MDKNLVCPVCRGISSLHDVVDFNKSCVELSNKFLPLSGIPVYYALCSECGFCFAPQMYEWSSDEMRERIYNSEYILVDPEYVEIRAKENAANIYSMFGRLPPSVKHLDYGGGNKLFARLMSESGWDSISYDPFIDKSISIEQLGKFELITVFEVFEHVADLKQLMSDLRLLLSTNGLILFTTVISDNNIHPNQRLSWWYASPRNGHISLFSIKSLAILAQENAFNFASFSQAFHVFFTKLPSWATHIIRTE